MKEKDSEGEQDIHLESHGEDDQGQKVHQEEEQQKQAFRSDIWTPFEIRDTSSILKHMATCGVSEKGLVQVESAIKFTPIINASGNPIKIFDLSEAFASIDSMLSDGYGYLHGPFAIAQGTAQPRGFTFRDDVPQKVFLVSNVIIMTALEGGPTRRSTGRGPRPTLQVLFPETTPGANPRAGQLLQPYQPMLRLMFDIICAVSKEVESPEDEMRAMFQGNGNIDCPRPRSGFGRDVPSLLWQAAVDGLDLADEDLLVGYTDRVKIATSQVRRRDQQNPERVLARARNNRNNISATSDFPGTITANAPVQGTIAGLTATAPFIQGA